MKRRDMFFYADFDDEDFEEDTPTVISSSWCVNRSGIVLSFAVPMEVMSVDEIDFFSEDFIEAVKKSYRELIDKYFFAKTSKPIVTASHKGELIMMWSFQGDDDNDTRKQLNNYEIEEICYE